MGFEIKTTKREKVEELKILLFGISGSGKTSSVKTLPCKDEEVLVISTEKGTEVLRGREFALYDDCANDIRLFGAFLQDLKKDNSFKWLVWDSITDYAEKVKMKIEEDPPLDKNGRPNTLAIYGELKRKLTAANKFFLSMPNCNKLTIAGAAENKDTGNVRFNLEGGAKDTLGFYYDEIYGLRVKSQDGEPIRELVTNNNGFYECKSRMASCSDVPIELYEPVDFTALIKKAYSKKQK